MNKEKKFINNSKKMIIIDLILTVVLVVIDQITKALVKPLEFDGPLPIIDGVFELQYCENDGAAFGILEGQRIFFLFLALIFAVFMTIVIMKLPKEKKFNKLNIVFSFIFAGAIGNTLDRAINGYVTDFLYFKAINFPIFNIADIYITVSTVIVIILVIFVYKDEDFQFLKKNKEDTREIEE